MIICADDFGMAESIDQAVLELVEEGKVTAVSCAVSHPACLAGTVKQLAQQSRSIDLGLHLVLTEEGRPATGFSPALLRGGGRFPPFGLLLWRSLTRQLKPGDVKPAIEAQYRRFEQFAGRPPDFIDGHLHVHQFPGIGDALLDFLAELPASRRPYVRNTHMPMAQLWRGGASLPKNILIGTPGTRFLHQARQRGFLTNTGFAGVYNYRPGADYSRLFGNFLTSLTAPNALLMTHPGLAEPWRQREYEALRNWRPARGVPNRFHRLRQP